MVYLNSSVAGETATAQNCDMIGFFRPKVKFTLHR